jgi:hypothetical protein
MHPVAHAPNRLRPIKPTREARLVGVKKPLGRMTRCKPVRMRGQGYFAQKSLNIKQGFGTEGLGTPASKIFLCA